MCFELSKSWACGHQGGVTTRYCPNVDCYFHEQGITQLDCVCAYCQDTEPSKKIVAHDVFCNCGLSSCERQDLSPFRVRGLIPIQVLQLYTFLTSQEIKPFRERWNNAAVCSNTRIRTRKPRPFHLYKQLE